MKNLHSILETQNCKYDIFNHNKPPTDSPLKEKKSYPLIVLKSHFESGAKKLLIQFSRCQIYVSRLLEFLEKMSSF